MDKGVWPWKHWLVHSDMPKNVRPWVHIAMYDTTAKQTQQCIHWFVGARGKGWRVNAVYSLTVVQIVPRSADMHAKSAEATNLAERIECDDPHHPIAIVTKNVCGYIPLVPLLMCRICWFLTCLVSRAWLYHRGSATKEFIWYSQTTLYPMDRVTNRKTGGAHF